MVRIKKQYVSQSIVNRLSYGGRNSKRYIVVHETANLNVGADAQAHANLQSMGNRRTASWHWQVDDVQAIQSFSDNVQAFHAGSKYYNQNGIGIEMAVNSDGDYNKMLANAISLIQDLMRKYNIPLKNVIRHNDTSGKQCPRILMSGSTGNTWASFKSRIGGKVSKPNVKPSSSVSTIAKEVIAGKWGNNPGRSRKLRDAGYNPSVIQSEVNRQLKQPRPTKVNSDSKVAEEVLAGKWGNDPRRSQDLKRAGYNPTTIQMLVNQKLTGSSVSSKPKLKSNTTIAKEVIAGKWGTGKKRRDSLTKAGYNASAIQRQVNQLLKNKSTKSVTDGQMVTVTKLYSTSESTKNVRSSSIRGYVDTINNNWRNEIRLKSSKNGYYIGFSRKEHIV